VVVWVNTKLRAMFGCKTGKSATGWIKLHKDDLRNFYFSPGIILALVERIRWTEHVVSMADKLCKHKLQ